MAAAAGILLIYAGKGPSAVWGTATFGALIGVGVAVFQSGFNWWTVGMATVIGTFIGLALECLPLISGPWSRGRRP